ncbi:MAG: DNA helicase RecQ [Chitinophagales bacterium]
MFLKDVLKKYFGYDSFRDTQEEIINYVVAGNDTVVVMPTGAGKSLCFQIPSLMFPGLTVVISPLIALMKDQVDGLKNNGIAAEALNSSMSNEEQRMIFNRIASGELKMLYVAPERLMSEGGKFIAYLKQLNISLFAIDEAHCVSMWGHDFRPEYLQLAALKQKFPNVPLIALTASADEITRKDIADKLLISNAKIFISSFNRSNIHYFIEQKKNSFYEITEYLSKHPNDSGIIYALSRANTEAIAEQLNQVGFLAKYYHAGMDSQERSAVQEDFKKDNIKIIVATIAFGMGIDKPDVRFVIHYNLPKNIESYYQETGRAGRDGLKSDAILFYSYGDVVKLKKFAAVENNPEQSAIMLKKLDQMAGFCNANKCRRRMLLEYFGEKYDADNCGSCDFCLTKQNVFDATIIAQKALSAVKRTGEVFGMHYLIDLLRGSKSEKIRDHHKQLKTYGIGADISRDLWTNYFRELINKGYLKRDERGEFPKIIITEKGDAVLKGQQTVFLDKVEERIEAKETSVINYDKTLFGMLRNVRSERAREEDMPPYIIASDITLQELAAFYPLLHDHLYHITGFGEIKISKYGKLFLEVIKEYCELNRIDTKIHLKINEKKKAVEIKRNKPDTTDSKRSSLYLFRSGKSIKSIAEERKLAITTVESHLNEFIESGEIKLTELMNEQRLNTILNAVKRSGDGRLKPIKEMLGNDYTYGEIRAVITHLKVNS